MCNYQQLSMNTYGYVINYNCCGNIELAFYTTVVRLKREKLKEIYTHISQLYNETDKDTHHNIKRFGVQVDNNTRMALTLFELKQLMDMIDESQLIMQAYDIIESPAF